MIKNVIEAEKSGRVKRLTYDEAKRYQHEHKETDFVKALLSLIEKGDVIAFWDDKDNEIIYVANRGIDET